VPAGFFYEKFSAAAVADGVASNAAALTVEAV
jgi:hypothetical protein